jgi:acetyl-CoA acetyltransferase
MRVLAAAVFAPDGAGALEGFQPRDHVADRKQVKLMSRSVQLGVAAVRAAVAAYPGWEAVDPERRGLFVGTSPGGGEPEDLLPALEAGLVEGRFDLRRFGEAGIPLVPPLWLVRGLTNNVVGFAGATHDIRGPNTTRCDGRSAGLAAILDAARCVAEGRADVVVAGGCDSLLHAEGWLGAPPSEGAAFVVLGRGDGPGISGAAGWKPAATGGWGPWERGAASGAVELVRRILAGDRGFSVEVHDPGGAWARVEVS